MLAATVAAAAGDAPSAAGDQLEEVIVSARFQAEQSQRTPLAISTVTAQMIEERGITSVADMSASLPNVTFVQSGQQYGRSVTAFVRGIGQADSSIAFNPAVGIYLDDVYIGGITGANLDLVDIASVDVLRGPQGTLFGANSEAGAVRIHTIKPMGDDSGYVSIGYGSYDHVKITGGFDISLIDNVLFLRASGVSDKQQGYQKVFDYACLAQSNPSLNAGNLPLIGTPANGCKLGTFGGTDVNGGRVALRWLPVENLEVNIAADLLNDTGEPQANTLIALNQAELASLNTKLTNAGLGVQLDNRFLPPNPYVSYDSSYDPLGNHFVKPTEPLMNFGYSGTIDWTPSDTFQLKSVTAYRRDYGSEYTSNSASPIQTGLSGQYSDRHQISEEVDLSGRALNNALDWAVGGFYYKSSAGYSGDIDLPGIVLPFPVVMEFYPVEASEDTNKSAFAHLIYHFTDALGLEVGIRHTNEEKNLRSARRWRRIALACRCL